MSSEVTRTPSPGKAERVILYDSTAIMLAVIIPVIVLSELGSPDGGCVSTMSCGTIVSAAQQGSRQFSRRQFSATQNGRLRWPMLQIE